MSATSPLSKPYPFQPLVVSLILLLPLPLHAQPPCTAPASPEPESRWQALEAIVREHEPSYRRWAGGFLSLHLAMVGVQLSLALSADNEGAAAEAWIGTISSALGLITLLISWPALVGSLEIIEKRQAQEARAQHELMRELESRIERQLSQGSFVRSPIPPLLNTLYLTTASSILLFGWERIGGALLLAIGGSIIANARLILYPSGLEATWHGYANRHLKACPFH